MGFNLLSDSLPFCSFLHIAFSTVLFQLFTYLLRYQQIHLYLGLTLIFVPIGFHSNILLGVLL